MTLQCPGGSLRWGLTVKERGIEAGRAAALRRAGSKSHTTPALACSNSPPPPEARALARCPAGSSEPREPRPAPGRPTPRQEQNLPASSPLLDLRETWLQRPRVRLLSQPGLRPPRGAPRGGAGRSCPRDPSAPDPAPGTASGAQLADDPT